VLYKYVGIGLLALFAIIAIPVTTNAETDDPRMYGMTTLALKDSTGNVLFETILHNEVLDRGTRYMFDRTFFQASPLNTGFELVNAICVTNAPNFAVVEGHSPSQFNSPDTLEGSRCITGFDFTITSNSADSGTKTFTTATHIDAGSTITGIGLCHVPTSGSPTIAFDCTAGGNSVMFAEIDITDTIVNTNNDLEVRYVLNLD